MASLSDLVAPTVMVFFAVAPGASVVFHPFIDDV
jgi:hypothetical protein